MGTTGPAPFPSDLRNAQLPAGVCAADAPQSCCETASGGPHAQSYGAIWGHPNFIVVINNDAPQAEGDVDKDGQSELAIAVTCADFGGGNNRFTHVLVLKRTVQGLAATGNLFPSEQADVVGLHLQTGRMVPKDAVFTSKDPECCPSGSGSTT
jgi:hypothetical protein